MEATIIETPEYENGECWVVRTVCGARHYLRGSRAPGRDAEIGDVGRMARIRLEHCVYWTWS